MVISHPRHFHLNSAYINVFPLPRDRISSQSRLRVYNTDQTQDQDYEKLAATQLQESQL